MPRKTRRRISGTRKSRRIRRRGTRRVRIYYRGGNTRYNKNTRYNSEGGDWKDILYTTTTNVSNFVKDKANNAGVYTFVEKLTGKSNPTTILPPPMTTPSLS